MVSVAHSAHCGEDGVAVAEYLVEWVSELEHLRASVQKHDVGELRSVDTNEVRGITDSPHLSEGVGLVDGDRFEAVPLEHLNGVRLVYQSPPAGPPSA